MLLYYHCGIRDKSSMFLSVVSKNLIFYVVFNAELNGTIRSLGLHHTIIDLLWPSWALLGYSGSILRQKHKI